MTTWDNGISLDTRPPIATKFIVSPVAMIGLLTDEGIVTHWEEGELTVDFLCLGEASIVILPLMYFSPETAHPALLA